MEDLTYQYRPNPIVAAGLSALSGLAALHAASTAMNNSRGLRIDGPIRFGPEGATFFHWFIAAVCLIVMVIGTIASINGVLSNSCLTLSKLSISAPASFCSLTPTVVEYANVRCLAMVTMNGQRSLVIYRATGLLRVNESWLPNTDAFEVLCSDIATHIPVSADGLPLAPRDALPAMLADSFRPSLS